MSGIRLHARTMPVQAASLELRKRLGELIKEHDLTFGEINRILIDAMGEWNKYHVRAERHPEDPEKKGDEA